MPSRSCSGNISGISGSWIKLALSSLCWLFNLCMLCDLQVPPTAVTPVRLPAPKVLRIAAFQQYASPAAGSPNWGLAALSGEPWFMFVHVLGGVCQ
jgi:hypothetical protein